MTNRVTKQINRSDWALRYSSGHISSLVDHAVVRYVSAPINQTIWSGTSEPLRWHFQRGWTR